MKTLILFVPFFFISIVSFAQESMESVMEKRAKEMHRVIGLSDKEQWKKFIKENYSEVLINKPMKAKVDTQESDGNTTSGSKSETNQAANIEGKAGMFERLHGDFGDSKLVSIKSTGDKIVMILDSSNGMRGTFTLKFTTAKPYLIDGLGIEVGN